MVTVESLNAQIPESHTTAILQGETIRISGNLESCKHYWNEIPFYNQHGLFSFIVKAIDNKWYLASWQQF